MKPLNGEKTRPLSDTAKAFLRGLVAGPVPRQAVNPALANRLLREALVVSVRLPSPYKTHNGALIEHLSLPV